MTEPTAEPNDATEGAAPGDNTTLTEVLAQYAEQGYAGNITVTEDGMVRCPSCRTEAEPGDVAFDSLRRLEGASDPDDMLAVLAVTCTGCGEKGVAVVHYGPTATREEADVLAAMTDERSSEA